MSRHGAGRAAGVPWMPPERTPPSDAFVKFASARLAFVNHESEMEALARFACETFECDTFVTWNTAPEKSTDDRFAPLRFAELSVAWLRRAPARPAFASFALDRLAPAPMR